MRYSQIIIRTNNENNGVQCAWGSLAKNCEGKRTVEIHDVNGMMILKLDWIRLAQDSVHRRTNINTAMNHRIPQNI